jgi:hypothetical protein
MFHLRARLSLNALQCSEAYDLTGSIAIMGGQRYIPNNTKNALGTHESSCKRNKADPSLPRYVRPVTIAN